MINKAGKLAIIGAGGHGKVLKEIAQLNGFLNIFFFDDYKVVDNDNFIEDRDRWEDKKERLERQVKGSYNPNENDGRGIGIVYYNGLKNEPMFEKVLKFKSYFVELECNDNWVEEAIINAKSLMNKDTIPKGSYKCDTCQYLKKRWDVSNLNK